MTEPRRRYTDMGEIGRLLDLMPVEEWRDHRPHALYLAVEYGFLRRVHSTNFAGGETVYTVTPAGRLALELVDLALENGWTREMAREYRPAAMHYEPVRFDADKGPL